MKWEAGLLGKFELVQGGLKPSQWTLFPPCHSVSRRFGVFKQGIMGVHVKNDKTIQM